ncbi:hypothetical protein NDU88_011789 [Pleurodeles waltl]|uniref:Uncharacterized protein n=1 Tax=Pleurodeles waltl TaxID=8319 RepID=A0AAV7S2A5_PLEWA|nr:hypothetical protein NDU88_011789 [Pleurodeles waltl]
MSCVPPTDNAPPQDKLDLILQQIVESRLAIEQQMGAPITDVSFLKDEHCKLAGRVKTNETTLAVLECTNEVHATKINNLTRQVELLQERAEDDEGRACRNNTRILGVLEGTEGQLPTQYIENWL